MSKHEADADVGRQSSGQAPVRPAIALPPVDDEAPLTPQRLWRVVRKSTPLFLACWAAIFAVTLFWTISSKKTYRAEALVRFDPTPPRPLGQKVELINETGNVFMRREFYETEFRIIRSRRVTTAVVVALGLNADPGFLGRPSGSGRPSAVSVDDAATILMERLSVDPIRDSSLAMIRYEDYDPKRAESVLKMIVRVYLNQNLENASRTSSTALEWLNAQLGTLKSELETSELGLNKFREDNHILSISLEDRNNMISTQLEEITKHATALEIRRIERAARYAELKDVPESDPQALPASVLLQSQLLEHLRSKYAEHTTRYEELLATRDEKHPLVVAAKAQIDTTAKAISTEIRNIKAAAARDLRETGREIAELKKVEEDVRKQAHELQSMEVPYKQLKRTAANNEKLYSLVLERARETDLTRVMSFNNMQAVDEPSLPTKPFRPNVPMNLAVGAVLGLLVGLATVLIRDLTDRTIKTPLDVESQLGATCLGLLPTISQRSRRRTRTEERVPFERDLDVARRPEGGVAEAARAIRTNLTFASPDHPYRTIAVTSSIPAEGKTTVACAIATVLAQSGLRVLLIDTDLRRPRLHRTFQVSNDTGVSLAVTGQCAPLDAVSESTVPNLWVLPSGPIPPNPAEILQSARFKELVEHLGEKFDRIVFDTPPLLPVTDAAILSALVDGMIVVTRAFATQRSATRQGLRHLHDVRAHVIGVVLNAVDFDRSEYREYHYYYKRDGYYSSDAETSAA